MHSAPSSFSDTRRRSFLFLMGLSLLLLATVLVALSAGSYQTPLVELIKGLFGQSTDANINLLVRANRLPRICTALLAGGGLGVTGCVFQAILHNPLASSSTLGVSQGAGFGAAFSIIVLNLPGRAFIPLFAFLGSMAVALLILALSRLRPISAQGIVLAGVAISAMFSGATTLIQYFADEVQLSTLLFWTFGDLGATSWSDVGLLALLTLPVCLLFLAWRWDFNALLQGTETASSLGIRVGRLTLQNMVLCCLICSVIVSQVGLISFIGLAAPHMVRLVVGHNHSFLLPGSMLAGGLLLLLGDLLARTVWSPVVLPIGAITAFSGGPLFLYLLLQGGRRPC